MDLGEIVGYVVAAVGGAAAVLGVVLAKVMPLLKRLAELTPTEKDDRALEAVDVAMAEAYGSMLEFIGNGGSLEELDAEDFDEEEGLEDALNEARARATARLTGTELEEVEDE